jgi:hypothetical protein
MFICGVLVMSEVKIIFKLKMSDMPLPVVEHMFPITNIYCNITENIQT